MASATHKGAAMVPQKQLTIDSHRKMLRDTTIGNSCSLHISIPKWVPPQKSSIGKMSTESRAFRRHNEFFETQWYCCTPRTPCSPLIRPSTQSPEGTQRSVLCF